MAMEYEDSIYINVVSFLVTIYLDSSCTDIFQY